MKHSFALLILGLALTFCANDTKKEDKVWICTGSSSSCYHSTKSCRGLGNCKASIKEITLKEAQQMNRRPCKMCCK